MSRTEAAIVVLPRELAPHVLGVLVRRNGNFEDFEDARAQLPGIN